MRVHTASISEVKRHFLVLFSLPFLMFSLSIIKITTIYIRHIMYHILYQYFISFNFFSFKTEFHTAQDDFQLPCSQGCPQAPDPPAYSSRGPESQMFEMTLGIFIVYDLLRR